MNKNNNLGAFLKKSSTILTCVIQMNLLFELCSAKDTSCRRHYILEEERLRDAGKRTFVTKDTICGYFSEKHLNRFSRSMICSKM